MLTPMNDGSYLMMWFPVLTDKEDKRCCRFNWTKERAVGSIRLGISRYIGENNAA
ncbi:hypothetical protein [Dysgonomonas sp. 520]|uniref:hypothetical protein n=1 Tax=Dysgonomonas sp. 520 TaxID=2302931 RepID=UPI001C866ED8|nr:hypothetical protein [Dysgonomonas sp. 520]